MKLHHNVFIPYLIQPTKIIFRQKFGGFPSRCNGWYMPHGKYICTNPNTVVATICMAPVIQQFFIIGGI